MMRNGWFVVAMCVVLASAGTKAQSVRAVPRPPVPLPGARVLEKLGEARYRAGMTVKLGPMTLSYEGEVELLARDATTRRARLSGSAREARGQGTASAEVAFFTPLSSVPTRSRG